MIVVVAFNLRVVDRDQQFLMPASMAEWLPEDHLAWCVIDVVDQLDLAAFDQPYRPDGRVEASRPARNITRARLRTRASTRANGNPDWVAASWFPDRPSSLWSTGQMTLPEAVVSSVGPIGSVRSVQAFQVTLDVSTNAAEAPASSGAVTERVSAPHARPVGTPSAERTPSGRRRVEARCRWHVGELWLDTAPASSPSRAHGITIPETRFATTGTPLNSLTMWIHKGAIRLDLSNR
jgi:hypothetical protein